MWVMDGKGECVLGSILSWILSDSSSIVSIFHSWKPRGCINLWKEKKWKILLSRFHFQLWTVVVRNPELVFEVVELVISWGSFTCALLHLSQFVSLLLFKAFKRELTHFEVSSPSMLDQKSLAPFLSKVASRYVRPKKYSEYFFFFWYELPLCFAWHTCNWFMARSFGGRASSNYVHLSHV